MEDLIHATDVIIVEDKTKKFPNPGPLGLACFGLTTLLLNLHNAGLWPEFDSMIMGMGLFFGGFAQIVAGILEFPRNNTFGLVAFVSYGSFWISLCFIHILPKAFGVDPPSALAVAFYLFIWGVFTLFMTVGTFKAPVLHVLQPVFILLLILFMMLAVENLIKHFGAPEAAGYVQIVCGIEGTVLGLLAMYASAAEMLNAHFDRVVLPISYVFGKKSEE